MIDDILAILKAPFSGKIDALQLFLIVGLVIIFAMAWAFMIHHIRMAATEVL